jgi:hypothetical protein
MRNLNFGFLRGGAGKSPQPASGIKENIFSLRRLRRRSEKTILF